MRGGQRHPARPRPTHHQAVEAALQLAQAEVSNDHLGQALRQAPALVVAALKVSRHLAAELLSQVQHRRALLEARLRGSVRCLANGGGGATVSRAPRPSGSQLPNQAAGRF